ncbi:Polyketide cyclase / dehydrase and lipid transport [Flavobacterium gillisiae]|uniref:Polyketide cyclase / dehydrase and lipid transport n=1 Tax=Flavobacterium gillisiae TaxID=150146 RepID=A0A1H4FPJ1_9FLAO|nr:SRPBCC family protein [Flavobacterium gillisiae]SEA99214.1 Polyketide cyclase / dehydrase and lipid transport [Flavobacterium gillisiae]
MRILKYIFLLLLLSIVALSIFIATQKGNFSIERSKIINSPKSAVFNYVNDYRNWADFGSWTTEDPEMKIVYPQVTVGKGASYSWEGKDGPGEMRTLFVKENDSIAQKMNYNGTSSSVFWSFKDTVGGTKVTWKTTGEMSFLFKVYTALNGGVDKVIGIMYEKSLANLDKSLDYEINTFSVKVNGLSKKPQSFYLAQTFTSELSKINKNTKIVIPTIIAFCEENEIDVNGKPFVIYHTYDVVKGLAKISICVPIKKEIFISYGSDMVSGKLEASEGVKTTLTGDYSHIKDGYDKALAFLNKNLLTQDPLISHIEIYSIGKNEMKNPSKWVTEVYIPVLPKIAPVKAYTPAPVRTTVVAPEATPVSSIVPAKVIKPVVKPTIKLTEPKKLPTHKTTEEETSEF